MPRLHPETLKAIRVEPGRAAGLAERDTTELVLPHAEDWSRAERKEFAGEVLEASRRELTDAQQLLYASDSYAVLVVFQALDAAGKDGTIRHVMSGVNPQGCRVVSFKQPSSRELSHDFLWRCVCELPQRGEIGIFNRSYYEEVLVVRVHPHLLDRQRIPETLRTHRLWEHRFESINDLEKHLHRNGTRIVKFFLHLSWEEQRKRFLRRIEDPTRNWKFSAADLAERGHWEDYQAAYEEALTATSTHHAPWHVIPADHKWAMRALVAAVLVNTIDGLDLSYPELDPDEQAALVQAKATLEAEQDT